MRLATATQASSNRARLAHRAALRAHQSEHRLLLMLIGVYGLLLEGYNPGAVAARSRRRDQPAARAVRLPGLSVNYAGLGLMLLGWR